MSSIGLKTRLRLILSLSLLVLPYLAGCSPGAISIEPMVPSTPSSAETVEIITPTLTPKTTFIPAPIPAFPGAEGFGSTTVGGRGGKVIKVTNLGNDGPGTLRFAIEAEGPRIVVFSVAGTIELESDLDIINPYITIAGQTAPGGGITLRGISQDTDPLIDISTHDVVLRYLTLRAGPPAAGDAMNIYTMDHNTYNIVIDHNSMSWGVDQVFATWYDVHDISIQWNIFSEALNCSIHPKGCHSKGPMLGSYSSDENNDKPGAANISFHHNLMAHNGERTPLVKTSGICDIVNNVVYNPQFAFSHVDMENQLVAIPVNYVGNYFKPGPDTVSGSYGIRGANVGVLGAEIFVQGNIGPHRMYDYLPEIDIVHPDSWKYVISTRHPVKPVTITSAAEAYRKVLADAGANIGLKCDGTFYPRRDAIDIRIINDVLEGTGKIIDDPSEVGGWINPGRGTTCVDSDQDGMPDVWEEIYGFNPDEPSDGPADANEDGYTNIEEYLNGTDPIH